jgi:GntR family transcriptional regulator/MocR family aminotransferase
LRLGFLVVPPELARRFGDLVACLAPAPAAMVQHAIADFMQEGHYLRHLRRMKRVYASRREALLQALREQGAGAVELQSTAGMAVVARLHASVSDVDIAVRAREFGLAPTPLSPWYVQPPRQQGLLLGVTNIDVARVAADCRKLAALARPD